MNPGLHTFLKIILNIRDIRLRNLIYGTSGTTFYINFQTFFTVSYFLKTHLALNESKKTQHRYINDFSSTSMAFDVNF